jgi:hypothetical protein
VLNYKKAINTIFSNKEDQMHDQNEPYNPEKDSGKVGSTKLSAGIAVASIGLIIGAAIWIVLWVFFPHVIPHP